MTAPNPILNRSRTSHRVRIPAIEGGTCGSFRRRKNMLPLATKSCALCGQSFTPSRRDSKKNPHRYCSRQCVRRAPRPGSNFNTPPSERSERIRANGLINERFKRGVYQKPAACDRCGVARRLDKHHPDYTQPTLVAFLCRSCHMLAHNRRDVEQECARLARELRPVRESIESHPNCHVAAAKGAA